ncbi:hypothetical protein [Streptomyces sp. BE133]|uniref:hypothetical protein n=1 Tax=Streptomyces sp. BE133 TaxID=3002523 RepID=UPI002E7A9E40|nr:hypothetical protein [Streptomyces sp. BE133]MEE1812681.1 hypothetical protein [Streptomyces sp. BE133]
MATATEAPASNTAEGPTSHTQNQANTRLPNTFGYTRAEQIDALHKLREPFLPTEIRYLPRVWCRACKDSRGKGCQHHTYAPCDKCKQRMPRNGHIDLRFVGHAEATNRLLNVDPFWDWEPLTVDERGLPQVDGYRGLWIRLTVCGMSRLGYGHAGDKTGGDAVKEVIGDAIRNAGMRFGMALDLWTSSDLEIIESGGGAPDSDQVAAAPAPQSASTSSEEQNTQHVQRLVDQAKNCWANAIALTQVLGDAEKHNVADEEVNGPNGWQTLRALLNDRITVLNQEATTPASERSAA